MRRFQLFVAFYFGCLLSNLAVASYASWLFLSHGYDGYGYSLAGVELAALVAVVATRKRSLANWRRQFARSAESRSSAAGR